MDWVEFFCDVDDFCQEFVPCWHSRLIAEGERKRRRESQLALSEILTVLIGFHRSGYRTFKQYYHWLLAEHMAEFPQLVSDQRFVELTPGALVPLAGYLMTRFGEITGIAFVDSTALAVCGNKRITRHRVFADQARIGRTTIGWFFGFKVHLVINDCGELLGGKITAGNVDDRSPVRRLCRGLFGKLFGDKGDISGELTADLLKQGLRLVTGLRKNLREQLLPLWDKRMLRKRSLIETVIDQLKNISQIEHSRHRSPTNFLVNLFAGLIAYTHQPKKPSLNLTPQESQQLKQLAPAMTLLA
jgi:Transposase DDE domain